LRRPNKIFVQGSNGITIRQVMDGRQSSVDVFKAPAERNPRCAQRAHLFISRGAAYSLRRVVCKPRKPLA
jgi:hypothetical protein